MEKIKIKFEGIDSWNRPVFKAVKSKERFGSTDILFNDDDTEKTVLNKINESHLCYFGNCFGCEPMGTPANNIKIIKEINTTNNKNKIKNIILELEKGFNKKILLFGYHKSIFKDLPSGYNLVFSNKDNEYPIMLEKTNYTPKYLY